MDLGRITHLKEAICWEAWMSIGLRVFVLTVFLALGFALPHASDVQAAEKRVTQKSKASKAKTAAR